MKQLNCLLLAGLLSSQLYAQDTGQPAENWTEINLAITDGQVIPRYAAFATASATLEQVADNFCETPGPGSLEALRVGYHDSLDAWQLIQHIQFGPITYFNWNFRVHYWPDENGTGARQLDALIAAQNAESLQPENFARESIGVQGFPALERLLFEDDSLGALQADPYRCQVAVTISRNISEIASGVYDRWVEEFRTTVANADERGFFESAEDATIDFLKAQVESVRRIQQQKVEEVVGENAERTRIRRAESWRSARSVKNIRLNVLALEALFNGTTIEGDDKQTIQLADVLYADDVDTVNAAFAEVTAVLSDLPDAMADVLAEEDGHQRLLEVAAGLDALFEALEASLKNTDLYLGFNSLDGD